MASSLACGLEHFRRLLPLAIGPKQMKGRNKKTKRLERSRGSGSDLMNTPPLPAGIRVPERVLAPSDPRVLDEQYSTGVLFADSAGSRHDIRRTSMISRFTTMFCAVASHRGRRAARSRSGHRQDRLHRSPVRRHGEPRRGGPENLQLSRRGDQCAWRHCRQEAGSGRLRQ